MAKYGKKRKTKSRKSTYRKRKSKTAYKKRKTKSKKYGQSRAIAIPRATFTPTTKFVEFVFDQTYVLKNYVWPATGPGGPGGEPTPANPWPNTPALGAKHNSYGLQFLVNDLYRPAFMDQIKPHIGDGPSWGACFPYGPQGASESLVDAYEGVHRWLSSGHPNGMNASAYKRSCVMKTKVDYRVSQMTVYSDGGVVPTANQCVPNIAIVAGFRQSATNGDTRCNPSAQLYDVETDRNQKRHNMHCQTSANLMLNPPEVRGSQTMSAKQLYGFKDWKDNSVGQNKDSICAQENHNDTPGVVPTPPQNSVFWHIGFYDRYPNVNNDQALMPDVEVRVKFTSLVMLTMPNSAMNTSMG